MPKPKTYKCPECGKPYKTQRGLDNHLLTHEPEAIEPPAAVIEPVAPPIEPANLTINLEQPKEDAKKLWSWKYGKWVLLLVLLILLYAWKIHPWLKERANEKDRQRVESKERELAPVYDRMDSLAKVQRQQSDSIRLAVDVSSEAKAVATKANTDLNQVRRESEREFKIIKRNSDELLKALDTATSVINIDRHLDSIERARATRPQMFQN